MPNLETPRLKLITFGLELVQATLEDRSHLAKLLDATVHVEWPNPDFAEVLPEVLEGRKTHPQSTEWRALIVHKADRVLMGDIGFFGPPGEEGSVTVGYGVVPSYRGQGYASEALQAMMKWGFAQVGVRQILADCEAWNVGSIRVLEKAGMQQVEVRDGLISWQSPGKELKTGQNHGE